MKATEKDAKALAGLVRIVWPEHAGKAPEGIVLDYMKSGESAVFAEKREEGFVVCATTMLKGVKRARSGIWKGSA